MVTDLARHILVILFGIVLAMALLLVAIYLADPVPNAAGVPHPLFEGMQAGGDGEARLAPIALYAFLFQSLLLLFIVCLAILGVAEAHRTRAFLWYMATSFVLMMIIWWQMFSRHQQFLETGETGYFLGFPVATAWQVYGTWFAAIPLIVLYCLGFRKFILTHEDEEEYNRLLDARSDREKQD